MNLSYNQEELLENYTWKGTFNDDSVCFGIVSAYMPLINSIEQRFPK